MFTPDLFSPFVVLPGWSGVFYYVMDTRDFRVTPATPCFRSRRSADILCRSRNVLNELACYEFAC